MVNSSRQTSTFSEFYRLYHIPRSSHILGSTILADDLLRDPALVEASNSHQSPQNSSSSSLNPPKRRTNGREKNPGLYAFLKGTTDVILLSAVAPLERVCLLMRCQNEMIKSGHLSSPYKGITDCFQRTIKNEGVLSLWRGNCVNVITPLAIQATLSAAVLLKRNSQEVNKLSLWILPFGGMLGLLFQYPLDYARTRLGNDVKTTPNVLFSLDSSCKSFGNWKFNGVFDVFKKTLQWEGIVGLYRGYTAACIGLFAYKASTLTLALYTEKQIKEKQAKSTKHIAAAAFLSLTMAVYPVRTISHRMMMTSGERNKYKGAVDAVRQIVKYEGVSSLYKGFTAYVMHACAQVVILRAFYRLLFPGPTRDKLNKD